MPAVPTIFIVDDDASVRRALGRVMTAAGFACEAFASADEFFAQPAHAFPGCIVADMTMQGTTGLELKQALNASGEDLPVIFLTAHDERELRAAAQQAGAAGYFRKPVDNQALLDAIRWAMEKYRAHQEQNQDA